MEVQINKTRAIRMLRLLGEWGPVTHSATPRASLCSAGISTIACCRLGQGLPRVGGRMKADETMLCTFLG